MHFLRVKSRLALFADIFAWFLANIYELWNFYLDFLSRFCDSTQWAGRGRMSDRINVLNVGQLEDKFVGPELCK